MFCVAVSRLTRVYLSACGWGAGACCFRSDWLRKSRERTGAGEPASDAGDMQASRPPPLACRVRRSWAGRCNSGRASCLAVLPHRSAHELREHRCSCLRLRLGLKNTREASPSRVAGFVLVVCRRSVDFPASPLQRAARARPLAYTGICKLLTTHKRARTLLPHRAGQSTDVVNLHCSPCRLPSLCQPSPAAAGDQSSRSSMTR